MSDGFWLPFLIEFLPPFVAEVIVEENKGNNDPKLKGNDAYIAHHATPDWACELMARAKTMENQSNQGNSLWADVSTYILSLHSSFMSMLVVSVSSSYAP